MDQWIQSFDDMFESNKALRQWSVPNNSDDENTSIKNAINQVAQDTGVDARFILSIVMQESNGCVRVHTTDNGVINPGLMQSHDGTGSCNKDGNVQTPCPDSEILQMIKDGVEGTSAGPGLKQLVAQEGGSNQASSYYKAARAYNSGSVAPDGNLGQGGATPCYSSDIANRLLGWATGASTCNSNIVSTLLGSNWSGSSSSGSSGSSSSSSGSSTSSSAPSATSSAAPAPAATTAAPAPAPAPAQPLPSSAPAPAATTSAPAASSSGASGYYGNYPQAVSSCQQYHTVASGDSCDQVSSKYGITSSKLVSLNPGLDSTCSNLWKGYGYCVKA
ncbi:hypothetical protein N7468_003201 [Penicillium chermesinum]|uniref:LysM domain-containing protein n=1 Tax=Penicillium chermesinum TaxID=63820 RepID=A0A9W9TRL4_9EURO|nr:uncharacterized protein N7468_003201 [Penicillium chermesinum]KAJ5238582.1 hypothetical protein N7468_003201 [Penicillium chermesinum]